MAYDPQLAERLRDALADQAELTERQMFGGLAFLIRGHMTVVATSKGGLMIRADPTEATELVESTPAAFAEMRGRPMKGWLRLDAANIGSDAEIARWVEHAVGYSSSLPPKA